MITFNELKEKTTPEIIKKMVELAEGETFDSDFINWLESHVLELFDLKILFPLLLHRAVEGWNKINPCKPIQILCNCISFITDEDDPASVEWGYDNEQYEPCHLTQCELAIWNCLLEVLR